jgi:CSLREA domain-containing protein
MSDFKTTFRVCFPSSSFRASGLIAAFAFLICLFAAQNAQSQSPFTVNKTADTNDGVCDTDCSLREAVAAANASAGDDQINFAIPAASCPAGVCTITLTLGALSANNAGTSLTIINSTGASNLLISGNSASRVFTVGMGGNLTLDGLTVTNGFANDASGGGAVDGSGIYNFRGTLSLINSVVSGNGNTTRNHGGGIYNNGGTLSLTNSTVSGNTVGNNGGGIYGEGGTTTLTNSTVSGNGGNFGGGIINSGGTLSLTNSTVSGNSAFTGGGIRNDFGPLNLTSVTIAFNTASNVGGVSNNGGTANLLNTIVARNTGGDFSGTIAAGSSFNLIGVDPMLAPLANNGGATQTHALLAGSPAIDQGISSGSSGTDQRGAGFLRPADNQTIMNATGGDGADIGAFEVQVAPTAATVSISGRVTTMNGRGIMNVRLSLTDSEGEVRTAITTSFGYYRFDDVQAGETYILSATGKHYTFSQPLQVLNINEENNAVNFTANSEKRLRSF